MSACWTSHAVKEELYLFAPEPRGKGLSCRDLSRLVVLPTDLLTPLLQCSTCEGTPA